MRATDLRLALLLASLGVPASSAAAQAPEESLAMASVRADVSSEPEAGPASDVDAGEVDASEVDASDVDASDVDASDIDSRDIDSAEPEDEGPALLGVGPDTPASTDPGMFPPLRPPARPRPYIEIHGYAALWVNLATDEAAPQHATETFRLRWAVLRFDAHPHPDLHVLARLGFMVDNPLLDFSVSWTGLPFLNVTLGQFRMPFGAAATTLAPQLRMMDRPSFVYAMTKASFRDIGVMLHSGEEGIAGGVIHYRLVAAAGTGRLLVGDPTVLRDARDLLWMARVILDAGPLIAPRTRLALGGTFAFTRDPAITDTDPGARAAAAANVLGRTWTPIDRERDTLLGGVDLTFSHAGFLAQAEGLVLDSRATDGSASRRAGGLSLELSYELPFEIEGVTFRPAIRGELVDPDFDVERDAFAIFAGGLDVFPMSFLRVSVFGQATLFAAPLGGDVVSGEANLRATATF